MRKPIQVLVTGDLLLGGAQGTKNYCKAPSARGMHKGDEGSKIVVPGVYSRCSR